MGREDKKVGECQKWNVLEMIFLIFGGDNWGLWSFALIQKYKEGKIKRKQKQESDRGRETGTLMRLRIRLIKRREASRRGVHVSAVAISNQVLAACFHV